MGYNKTYNILIVNSSAVYQITKGPAASGDIIQTLVRNAGEGGEMHACKSISLLVMFLPGNGTN